MRYAVAIAAAITLAAPAFADEVGVHVGPVGAGVTTGESHRDYDRDRIDSDRTTVIKEREPADRTTVIKKSTTSRARRRSSKSATEPRPKGC